MGRTGSGIGLGLAAACVALAAAAPAAAEGSALRKLIEVLHAEGTLGDEAHAALQAAVVEDERRREAELERATAALRDDQAALRDGQEALRDEIDRAAGPTRLVHRNRFRMKEEEEGFELGISGRIHTDSVWYQEDEADFASGPEIRRARVDFRGTVWEHWNFMAGFEMATGAVQLRGMSLTYDGFERFQISTGRMREPFGLDEQTGSNYTTFMERDPVSDVMSPGRNIGVAVAFLGEHGTTKGGVYWANDPEGGEESGFEDFDSGWAVTARQTFTPWRQPRRVVHLGLASSWRSGGEVAELRFRARPASHATNVRLVNTGRIEDVDRALFYGAEFAASLGPFFFQSEYIGTRIERDHAPTLDFDGYYAQASWFLTGESRPYRASRGVFGPIRPRRRFDLGEDGGPGAWEVALRYGNFDLNSEEIEGGKQDLVTVGLNWYPNANVRFMLNWVKVLDVDRRGSVFDDEQMSSIGLRSQVTF